MFGSLLSLIPIIGSVLPTLTSALNSPLAGSILVKAGDVAQRVFGTTSAEQIQAQIELDKTKLERFKAELNAETQAEQSYYVDIQSARQQTVELSKIGSSMAWGAPIMTALVTLGFFVSLGLFVGQELRLPEFQRGIIATLIGYLGAGFQQSLNYWLGSSRTSKDKDAVLAQVATAAVNDNNNGAILRNVSLA
jgi:hypothetical protein